MSTITQTQSFVRHRVLPPVLPTRNPVVVNGRLVSRVPADRPPFSLSDIRRAIPSYCFEKNLITSFGYLVYDLSIIISLFYLSTHIPTIAPVQRFGAVLAPIIQHLLWFCYWICQGSVMTGLWVIGHECGHGGFANTTRMNDIVGWIIHSSLLVPYFSWQISHRKHHSNTAHLQRDEVWVPTIETTTKQPQHQHHSDESERSLLSQLAASLYRSFRILLMLVIGWPVYLWTNATGNHSYSKSSLVNHFLPQSPIYADINAGPLLVILSDLGVLLMIGVLILFSHFFTFTAVIYYYLIPYLITHSFLVLITFLQHSDVSLPHYNADEWDWLRGALATVDRDYGMLNSVFHHITDSHVVHHIFSSMPHYHAVEATEAVKALLGPYYLFDDTPIPTALWRSFGECNYVKQDSHKQGVYWYSG